MIFSCLILFFLFIGQIVLLGNYYELYKTKILNQVANNIKNSDEITTDYLESIAYEKGICVLVYSTNEFNIVSNSYNRGCGLENNTIVQNTYIKSFIESNKKEDTLLVYNPRFNNKTLIKSINLEDDNYIFLYSSIEPLDSSIVLLKSQYIYIVILMIFLSGLIGYFISRQLSKPITKISDSAIEMAKGNFNVSFKSNSKIKEIIELSETLEQARIELSKTDELRRDLLANVGHDLKTPLTMIKAYAEMTKDLENQSQEKKKENLNIIIEETDRLTVLVNDVLELSKIQSNTNELHIEKFDLNDLINKIIKRYDILVEDEGYNFIYDSAEELIINADRKRIEQVIYNLMNNAVNYTGEDKKVIIKVIKSKKTYRVEIIDTGKGIKEDEIKYIWDKYYHNDKNHKRNTRGTGLGLSIVKNILEEHGYKYGVESVLGQGTTFYFIINK